LGFAEFFDNEAFTYRGKFLFAELNIINIVHIAYDCDCFMTCVRNRAVERGCKNVGF